MWTTEAGGYTDEQETKYGLVFNFSTALQDQRRAVEKGIAILADAGGREKWRKKRERMVREKVDLVAFLMEEVF
ncbi:MAG: hypothetical protein ACLFNW_11110 [Desulfobacterales bacterium]